MEKTYRYIVIAGLLVGLIVNALALRSVKHEVASLQSSVVATQQSIHDIATRMQKEYTGLSADTKKQLGEHERLITQLERMVNQ